MCVRNESVDRLTLANTDITMSKFFFKRRTIINLNSLHLNSKLTVEISKGYQKVLADTVFCVKNECVDTSKCRQTMSTLSKFFLQRTNINLNSIECPSIQCNN